jgi:transposase
MKTSNPQDCASSPRQGAKKNPKQTSRAKAACRQKAEGVERATKSRRVKHPNAAGIDIGSRHHYVAVPEGRDPLSVRSFATVTGGLEEMIEWLKRCKVSTVAMESTGVYWLPAYQMLERAGFEVLLVDARAVKHVAAHKSDVKDCQWLQELHTYGLLRGAFRPEDAICQLRAYLRQRKNLVEEGNRHILRMQKCLQEMNLLLHHVLSDVTGESGQRILDAILAGERDPQQLAKRIDARVKKSPQEVAAALTGDYTEPQLFILDQELKSYRYVQEQIDQCDQEILRASQSLPSRAEPLAEQSLNRLNSATNPPEAAAVKTRRSTASKRHSTHFELFLKVQLQRILGVDLTQVPGLGVIAVLVLLSEIGTNMKKWRSAKAFTSWLGLCPNQKISGGRVLSARTRKVASRAAAILRMAAKAIGKTDTPLGHFYRRKQAKLGAPKAITATARKLACLVYELIDTQQSYAPPSVTEYTLECKQRQIAALRRRAAQLDCEIVELSKAA